MSISGLAPGRESASISPPSPLYKSGVHTVAFQGAMSALGVMTIVLLCVLFRVCRKKRSWECLVQRVKDRRRRQLQEQQSGAQRRANEKAKDDVTVHWELQNDASQHVPIDQQAATEAASEARSGAPATCSIGSFTANTTSGIHMHAHAAAPQLHAVTACIA